MAIVKHIKSRNANYSAAINYLLFEHDEKTGKKIVDESGRSILRKEFYMGGLNCDPMSFDKECELTNAHFHKNKKREDIKSHHYIISYDPADVTENGLTGKRAQAISLELAKQMFPGYQALVVTHTDGHNESGNIHTHIVINSVRKTAVERQLYMDKPHEEAAGYKHRSTDKFMNTFKKTVMDRCQQEGLHQIDLLAPAERKITQKEYMAQKHGQQKLDEINQKIIEDGLKPTSTVFLTQKEYLRNAIDECAVTSNSFDEFQSKLLEQFQISVIEHRGRYSYLHPDRQKRITERALGTRYGKTHLEQTFLHKDPLAILYVRSHLRLVVNLQTNVKAMQSPAYAHRVKLSNLQQMANTIIYVQEHGFAQHRSDLRILNDQIRYTGQYYANKEVYSQFSKARYKGKYRKEHAKEIQKYEEARDWLRSFYQDGKMTSLKALTLQKEKLQQQIASEEEAISSLKEKLKDLD
ncbi:MAG: relaxase/mobilization nuclease domain-containing protein, partial [Lachnospiraceae bacterium]|nr:relaxase/mobilization nuclease domain-containing protein [Lachnospiraceae bacterium]